MTASWQSSTIGALCRSGHAGLQTGPFGTQLHASDYVEAGIPIVPTEAVGSRRINNAVLPRVSRQKAEELARHRLQTGDILFARRGVQATGRTAYVRAHESGYLSGTGVIRLRLTPSGPVTSEYLSHILAAPRSVEWLKVHAIGATMPNLNEGIIQAFPLRFPSIDEQHAISRILSALDDKIEVNERMNATLDAMARALFKSWFVDFDPVRAKAEGRAPSHMDAATAALFPDSFEDSSMGSIPEGWRAGTVGDLGIFRNERVEPTPAKDHERYVALDDMPSRLLALTRWRRGSDVNSSIVRFRKGDILFGAMRVYFHKVVPAPFNGITRTTTFVIVPKQDEAAAYLTMALADDETIAYADATSVGSTIPYAKSDSISRYPLPLPDAPVSRAFSERAQPMFDLMALHAEESRTLAELRDTLLPKLISGEVRVGAAAREVEVAV